MKTSNIILLSFIGIVLTSLIIIGVNSADDKTVGSNLWEGRFSRKTSMRRGVEAAPFDKIIVKNGIKVAFSQGASYGVEVEALSHQFDDVITQFSNNVLYVEMKDNVNCNGVKVAVSAPFLTEIVLMQSSSFSNNDTLKLSKLKIEIASGSEMDLNLKCDSLFVDATSRANCNLTGQSPYLNIVATYGSKIEAFSLQSKNAIIDTDSDADVKVKVSDFIDVVASHKSIIKCDGNPQVVKMDVYSGGSFKANAIKNDSTINYQLQNIERLDQELKHQISEGKLGRNPLIIINNEKYTYQEYEKNKFKLSVLKQDVINKFEIRTNSTAQVLGWFDKNSKSDGLLLVTVGK